MKEKYETLSLSVLRDLAKARGMHGITGVKKAELIEMMLVQDKLDAAEEERKADAAARAEAEPVEEKKVEPAVEAKPEPVDEEEEKPKKKMLHRVVNRRESMADVAAPKSAAAAKPAAAAAQPAAEEDPDQPEEEYIPEPREFEGVLEIMPDGFGFVRSDNYLPGELDVYVGAPQIRTFNLKKGDIISGVAWRNKPDDKFAALQSIYTINGTPLDKVGERRDFDKLTPIFPNERIKLEQPNSSVAMRIVDLISPIGKGQRGMIVSQPKAGKTTLLKEIASSITKSYPDMHLIILLIDERPEEVTDIREAISGQHVEVIHSTFDELPDHHRRVSEMTIEHAKRMVEQGEDVIILLDSITRLSRAYNLLVPPSGRTLSGGLDPAALHAPKRFFGAARNLREGGSLTILATALVETGSKMDDVVFEEFKGTGNMELILDRKLSEKRVFPAIDIVKSGTRRDDLLLNRKEQDAMEIMRHGINGNRKEDSVETIINMFTHTNNNDAFISKMLRMHL